VTEAADRETQGGKQPEAAPQVVSSRVPVIAVSLAALAVIGAATANSLPSFGGFSLPDFNQFSLARADRFSLPDFSRFSPPKTSRVATLPPPPPAPVPVPAPVLVPDPVVRAGLRDIQTSQQQNTDVLESLTQNAATQQADLKRITRQLALLTAQVNSLQNQAPQPLTTSSIPPPTTSSIPRPNPRTRVVHASRRAPPPAIAPPAVVPAAAPTLPKPVGPFSVGGAPLSPPPTTGSGAS
jgi:uncharacterized coiled-coil protein SlyX